MSKLNKRTRRGVDELTEDKNSKRVSHLVYRMMSQVEGSKVGTAEKEILI